MHDEATRVPLKGRSSRLPFVVYALALGTFLMLTTEFVVAGILPDIAADLQVSVARAGTLITVFAIGMIVGAPLMAMLTLRMPRRVTLMLALGVFAVGHVIVAVGSDFGVLLAARFLTALATGAFWAVAAVVATRVAGPGTASRAVGVVNAGGMLATVLGVPLGALLGQFVGWRGTFWALAILAVVAIPMIARHVPRGVDPLGTGGPELRQAVAGLGNLRCHHRRCPGCLLLRYPAAHRAHGYPREPRSPGARRLRCRLARRIPPGRPYR
ncbi:MFS transporter [Nocardiopsis alba]|uniref:MFS transporter n=1 Tax=Nocardiopsis alba TaxID=53437 RepID=UPI0033C061E5